MKNSSNDVSPIDVGWLMTFYKAKENPLQTIDGVVSLHLPPQGVMPIECWKRMHLSLHYSSLTPSHDVGNPLTPSITLSFKGK